MKLNGLHHAAPPVDHEKRAAVLKRSALGVAIAVCLFYGEEISRVFNGGRDWERINRGKSESTDQPYQHPVSPAINGEYDQDNHSYPAPIRDWFGW